MMRSCVLAIVGLGLLACHNAPSPPPSPVQSADTLRGLVAVVGPMPATQIVLRAAGDGGADVVLDGAPALRQLAGVEVWVRGARAADGRTLDVQSFAVRSVDGRPALDGLLVAEGAALYLELAGGQRLRIVNPPSVLRDHVGARIWLSGSLELEPVSFGVIQPKP